MARRSHQAEVDLRHINNGSWGNSGGGEDGVGRSLSSSTFRQINTQEMTEKIKAREAQDRKEREKFLEANSQLARQVFNLRRSGEKIHMIAKKLEITTRAVHMFMQCHKEFESFWSKASK
ncbi:MAG: hypothetical protein LPH21_16545 [Shewanella sp.]|nr:hypothetical protein [Shewanella sp.]